MSEKQTMKTRILGIMILLLAVFLLAGVRTPLLAAPPQQGGNLLNNPSFDQPYVDGVAQGWSAWHRLTEKVDEECLSGYHYEPKWSMESNGALVADGVTSQAIGNSWDTWSGGVYQTVDATPGVTYRFTFLARGRITNEQFPEPSEPDLNMNVRAGIDPNGSGTWSDADVVWGGAGSPHDAWQPFTVEATATGDKITVFTSANFGVPGVNQCRGHIDTWYDSAELVQAGPPPTNTPPPAPAATEPPQSEPTPLPSPTPEPEPETTAEPTAEAQPTAEPPAAVPSQTAETPEGGTICVNAFHDENGNGLHDASEGYMAGVTITAASDTEVVGQVVTEGSPTPKCFSGLEAGPYQVAQEVPGRLEMTTAANAALAVTAGSTIGVEFGSRLRQDEGDDAAAGEEIAAVPEDEVTSEGEATADQEGFSPLMIVGLAAIGLGIILLGALIFFLLRR